MEENLISQDDAFEDYISELELLWEHKNPALIPDDSKLYEFILIYVYQNKSVKLGDSLFTYFNEYPDYMLIERGIRKLRYRHTDKGMVLIPPKLTINDYLFLKYKSFFFEDEFLIMLNSNDEEIKVTQDEIDLIKNKHYWITLNFGGYSIEMRFTKWDDGQISKCFHIINRLDIQKIQYEKHYVKEVECEIEELEITGKRALQQHIDYVPKSIAAILQGGEHEIYLSLCFDYGHIEMIRLTTRGEDWNLVNSFYWDTGKRDPEFAKKNWYLIGQIQLENEQLFWNPSQNLVYRNEEDYLDWLEVQSGEELNDRVKRFILKDENSIKSFFKKIGISYNEIIEDPLSNGLDVTTSFFGLI